MNDPVNLRLEPVSHRRTYEEVVEQIRQQILNGHLKVGDRLPGERQLSEMLDVSRASVREAMRVLESMSIIRARTGTGPESGTVIVGEPGSALSDVLVINEALDTISLDEVIDVRCMLEDAAVRQAVTQADDAAIDHLRRLVADMRREEDPYAFLAMDADFHLAIAEVSENRLIAYLMRSLRGVIHEVLSRIFPHVDNWDEMRPIVAAEHEQIVELIAARDVDAAVEHVQAHIRHSVNRVLRADPNATQFAASASRDGGAGLP